MRRVSKADIKENNELYDGCTFLCPREWMDNAITGKCINTGGIIYDYDTLIQVIMEKDGISHEQASQIVDYNIDKIYPKLPKPVPVVIAEPFYQEEVDFDDEDLDD